MKFLKIMIGMVLTCTTMQVAKAQAELNIHPDLLPLLDPNLAPFYHGVASGDPTQHSVVIWTKLTLPKGMDRVLVNWELTEDSTFKKVRLHGGIKASAENDFTVKINVEDLKENTRYYYRFMYEKKSSLVGQTKTLPENPDKFSIAFASCSNYEWGYFNNYGFIAADKEVDLVVHLGDYIYEYAPGVYGDTSIGRVNVPAKEITSLEDYRTRYSLYRLDKDLMRLHQMKPMITTWDDHEIANNGYTEGAQNHQATEGDWKTRKSVGTQAYYEWMPVKETDTDKLMEVAQGDYPPLYRSFKLGNLMELIILDTRIEGRSKQVDSISDPHFMDTTRTILGTEQYNWLLAKLRDKTSTWKIIGNQVPFGPMFQPDMKGSASKYMDGWDGYPFERTKLINTILAENLKNIVWVTGDYHCSFAFENDLEGTKTTADNVSVEFVVTSITSANDDEWIPRDLAIYGQQDYLALNPHCRYVNNVDHGYVVVNISLENVNASFYYADTVKKPVAAKKKEKTYVVYKNKVQLVEEQ